MKRLTTLALAASLTACTSLSPEGQKVRLTKLPQEVAGCRFLGQVTVNGLKADLRNHAATALLAGTDKLLDLLADLWEAAEKTRLERFAAWRMEGEAEMHAVLRRLGDL